MVANAIATATRDADAVKVVEQIGAGKWRGPIEQIRKTYLAVLAKTGEPKAAKLAIDPEKKKRPGILWSGRFSSRKKPVADKLMVHSGLLCADADDVGERLPEVRARLLTSPHLFALFTSPSGTGIKAVFRVSADAERHGDSFRAVEAHVRELTGVQIDGACKDLARLCFVSFDPEAVLNRNAVELPVTEAREPAPAPAQDEADADTRHRIAADLLGPVTWTGPTRGLLTCPGQHLHTTSNGARDCEIHLDGPPTIYCFHGSCAGIREALNRELRSRIGKAEWQPCRGSLATEYGLRQSPGAECEATTPPPQYSAPPLALLPPALRDYVAAVAQSLDVDVAFVLLPLLSSLAAAIGNSRTLRIKQGFIQPAILWTTVVARSGTKKSPALSASSSFLLRRERDLVRLNAAAELVYEKQHREWDATEKKKRGAEPNPPPRLTCLLDDLTLAVVAPILCDNPRGALVAKDELASWFGSFGQFAKGKGGASADVSGWLTLFNGERLILDRKTNRESHRIFNPRLSIAGCIPPSVLRDVLTKDFFQRGLPARILFAAPPPRPNVWTDDEVPAAVEREAAAVFDRLFALEAEQAVDGPVPRELSTTWDGLEVFKAFYNSVGEHTVESEEREEAAWNKLTGGAARLALVGHLARGLDGTPLGDEVMSAAVALAGWFGEEAERIYASFSESPGAALSRRLVEFIARRGGRVTVREVGSNFRPLKNQFEEVDKWLNDLARSGVGQWTQPGVGPQGGRPTREFTLNSDTSGCPRPRNPQISQENEGFADADTLARPEPEAISAPATAPKEVLL
jgi:hypothetical protein